MMTKPKPLVSIIIVNWNGRCWLETCFPALAIQTLQDFEIILVDNGSQDDSAEWTVENWPDVRMLCQTKNLGFAEANNLGIQAACGEYIVTLNNDTIPAPTWLEALCKAVDAPTVGMVASQICLWQQPASLDSAGIEIDKAGIAWNRGYGQPVSTALLACAVFGPSAAAALYRRQMLEEIGFFDETYFAYYEDVDLAWRAQRAGWICRYSPQAQVVHWHSATGGKTPEYKTFLLGRNKIWTIFKNYEWPQIIWMLPIVFGVDVTAVLLQTVRNKNMAAINGRFQAFKTLKQVIQNRQAGKNKVSLAPISVRRYLFKQR